MRYLTDDHCKTARLYLLPKIHKGKIPPPGRPIVSANGCPTEKISQLVDHFLTPPTTTYIKSYVRDTTDFIQKLCQLGEIPPNCLIATMDVTSLYTNIPNDEGLRSALKLLNTYRPQANVRPSNLNLVKLLEMVLKKNNFQFNGVHYLQVGGTAMGTKAAPGLANCFMGNFEEEHVYKYRLHPLLYLRYLDDIFLIWQHTENELDEYLTHLNNCLPTIKFTLEKSRDSVCFLDTIVKIVDNKIETDLYSKPTDAHNYLLYKSAHPKKCKDSIPYSQFLRIRRICTKLSDFDKHVIAYCTHFQRRGYPSTLLENAALKARRIQRSTLLENKTTSAETTAKDNIIMVTRFQPDHDTLKDLVLKNWDFLGKTATTHHLYEKKLMVGYRRPKNLKDLIVRADVRTKKPKAVLFLQPQKKAKQLVFPQGHKTTVPTKQSTILDFLKKKSTNDVTLHGTTSATEICITTDTPVTRSRSLTVIFTANQIRNKCTSKKVCRYCPILNTSGKITCTATLAQHEAKTNITCNSSNLIYCITCRKCKKQYVGQTKRTLMKRFREHFYNIKISRTAKADRTEAQLGKVDAIGSHFALPDHDANDLQISVLAFITLTPESKEALVLRLKVEKKWIHLMRCPAPSGLNIFD